MKGKDNDVPQAIPPAPMITGMSNGAPLLSIVVDVMVIEDVKEVYWVKVVGANYQDQQLRRQTVIYRNTP